MRVQAKNELTRFTQSPLECKQFTRYDCNLSANNFLEGTKGRSTSWMRSGSPKIHNLLRALQTHVFLIQSPSI